MDTNANNVANVAQRLLERLAAYRSPDDWPQPMREAIAELKAEVSPPEPFDADAVARLNFKTPARKFPQVWHSGDLDERGVDVEQFVNKNVFLAFADVVKTSTPIAAFENGRATISLVLDSDGYNIQVSDVEEAFIEAEEDGFIVDDHLPALADTFQRLADFFRKKAEECE